MTGLKTISANYDPSSPDERRVFFLLRMVKYLLCWLLLWQGGMVKGSLVQIETYFPIPYWMTIMEVLGTILLLVVLAERSLSLDFTIRRSYFAGPLILMALLFFLSWVRGCYFKQHVAFIFEIHEAIEMPFLFLVISSAFRDERDREVLWKLLFVAVVGKSLDGTYIYFFSNEPAKYWGVVQSWRDGYILGIGVIGYLLLLHYRGDALKRWKWWMLASAPILALSFVMSLRRTFFVGAFVCMMVMFVSLPPGRRKLHIGLVCTILAGFLVTVLLTNPIEVVTRLSGITAPQNEGSAFIRLMELPNVLENIRRHPLFGVPSGIPWITYYRMPLSAVYTTLGTHNTYLYWPLRTGIAGIIMFVWLLCKLWKTALINYRLRTTEEDFFFGQWGIQMLIMYQVACFFGLMYADMMSGVLAVIMTVFQLQTKYITGRSSLREVAFWQTMRTGRLMYRAPMIERLRAIFVKPALVSQ
jgi:O-antigen ligase